MRAAQANWQPFERYIDEQNLKSIALVSVIKLARKRCRILTHKQTISSGCKSSCFVTIDFVNNTIKEGSNSAIINSNSYPMQILKTLLLMNCLPIAVENLFKACWNQEYDEKEDYEALESAIYRLKKKLASVGTAIRVYRLQTGSERLVWLRIKKSWAAFI